MAYVSGTSGARFNGIFDSLSSLVPSNTIASSILSGDWTTAVARTANAISSSGAKPPSAPASTPVRTTSTGSVSDFITKNQTALLLAAAGLAVLLLVKRR